LGSRGRIVFSGAGRAGKDWARLETVVMVLLFAAFFFVILMAVMGLAPVWEFHDVIYWCCDSILRVAKSRECRNSEQRE
jgi:hypothetical protein